MAYFKITNEDENHNGLQYHDGLVEDILPFNDNLRESCCPGGIYFSDEKNILEFCHYGIWIREITLPEDAKYVIDPLFFNKWRANKVFLHERRPLFTVKTFEWLIEKGANIHVSDYFALRYSAEMGQLEVVKYLVEKGADIHVGNDLTLKNSILNSQWEVVSYLIKNGAHIHRMTRAIQKYYYENLYGNKLSFLIPIIMKYNILINKIEKLIPIK